MIVVTTPTGQIGRHVLGQLIEAGEPVRMTVRDRGRIAPGLAAKGEVIEGSHADPSVLEKALDGAEAVFWCIPPDHRMADAREYYVGFSRAFLEALARSTVRRVVMVSSGGRGRSEHAGPIGAAHEVETRLEATGVDMRALRCGAFMENLLHQVEPLRRQGAFFYPIDGDVLIPVCATRDIGQAAVKLLRDRTWTGQAGVGVHGPADLSFHEMASIMSRVLARPIRFQTLPGPVYKARLVEHGASEAYAQGVVDIFREIARGLHDADPRTPESTTPTAFETWCTESLKPALGS